MVRVATNTLIGVAIELVRPAPIGIAVAVIVREPRREGFQLQTAVNGEIVAVAFEMQPGIRTLLTLN